MSEDKYDAIVVGAGLAGCTAALLLARAGLEVVVVERGSTAGSKNMTGGRLYAHTLESIIPGFADEAPLERCVTREKISFMTADSVVTMDYQSAKDDSPAARSYTVLRAQFDEWFMAKAEEAGAALVNSIRVDNLIVREGRVVGVKAGEDELFADVVILADGVNSMLGESIGMVSAVTPHHCAVGVKELIEFDEATIQDRFGCQGDEGVAWLFAGTPSDGKMGGGFIYTNRTSVSVGVVFGLHNIQETEKSVPQMLEDFKNHPSVLPLLAGGKLMEYSAHVVPEGGLRMVPKILSDGVLIAGDAAGFCLNIGFTIRGMDLAIASGEAAAKAVIAAKAANDFSATGLSRYRTLLAESIVLKDMQLYKSLPAFLDNERMFNQYPAMVAGLMSDLFTVNGPAAPLMKKALGRVKQVGMFNLVKDGVNGARAL